MPKSPGKVKEHFLFAFQTDIHQNNILRMQQVINLDSVLFIVVTSFSGHGTNLDCHAAVHAQGIPRIIHISTRVDQEIAPGTGNKHKVERLAAKV
ncbi:uncharacterized protein EV420DRAFT_1554273 [Desarmillaria tabescens]|uniref:Uncharacterized protein n=1 Tax=Armillaria tabescens TaxID=1929756 RepID=A0AA39K6P1_ARMTA|nr:uncharacterized protein EV420DRAFT_1554273 [Desarmillaria tabescens]KAK0455557.1 hypothetical protein EV420DRAFT_1554273 [Desarmillaria tabescens]